MTTQLAQPQAPPPLGTPATGSRKTSPWFVLGLIALVVGLVFVAVNARSGAVVDRIKNPNEAFERVARESQLEYSR